MPEKLRVLRHKRDGYIYWWTEELAKREDMEEVPYDIAFPPPPEPKTDTVVPPSSKVKRRTRKK